MRTLETICLPRVLKRDRLSGSSLYSIETRKLSSPFGPLLEPGCEGCEGSVGGVGCLEDDGRAFSVLILGSGVGAAGKDGSGQIIRSAVGEIQTTYNQGV